MKEDQRIRLSKQLLRNALLELLKEKHISKVSVREICERAQINRTTFYKYYGSQYELLEDIENMLIAQITEKITVDTKKQDLSIIQILKYIDGNADLFRLLVNNDPDPMFSQKLLHLPEVQQCITRFTENIGFSQYSRYNYEFFVNGGSSIIRSWLNKDDRESPEDMSNYICSLFNSIGNNSNGQ